MKSRIVFICAIVAAFLSPIAIYKVGSFFGENNSHLGTAVSAPAESKSQDLTNTKRKGAKTNTSVVFHADLNSMREQLKKKLAEEKQKQQ